MLQKSAFGPLILLFLLFQTLAITALVIPLTNTISLLNSTITPSASSKPLEHFISPNENATSPGPLKAFFDYRIGGTPLILRITELGFLFSRSAIEKAIDSAIREVVLKINTGYGGESINDGRFSCLTTEIDIRITALANGHLTYFLLGKWFVVAVGW